MEEKTIVFYEDELIAVKMKDGTIYVPVRRLCDNLGIDWPGQWQRIQRDEVMSEAANSVGVTPTQSTLRARTKQEMICLPLDLIPGWLFGIQPSRVKEETRDKLIRYRRECFRVLWDAFKTDLLPELQEPATDLTPADQMVVQAKAVYDLARHQASMERWLVHPVPTVRGVQLQTGAGRPVRRRDGVVEGVRAKARMIVTPADWKGGVGKATSAGASAI